MREKERGIGIAKKKKSWEGNEKDEGGRKKEISDSCFQIC